MYRSAFALASKNQHLVYLPPEISDRGGRVLKIMYSAPFSMAVSAITFAWLYSISRLSTEPRRGGCVMAKTVCAPVRAFSRETRSCTSAWTTSTLAARALDRWDATSRVRARILYSRESSGSLRTKLRIEPPCWPVAPTTARVLDMFWGWFVLEIQEKLTFRKRFCEGLEGNRRHKSFAVFRNAYRAILSRVCNLDLDYKPTELIINRL